MGVYVFLDMCVVYVVMLYCTRDIDKEDTDTAL